MGKMSVNDAAEYFGVSKEAIHNRVRRGSLEVVVEDGVKMVVIDETQTSKRAKTPTRRAAATRSRTNDDRYYKFLEEQNAKLQSRVETLETETRTLRDQKELMLIEERKKIEAIYKEKDEQLKNILSTISSQFMLTSPEAQEVIVDTVEAVTLEVEEDEVETKIISLKKHLKKLKVTGKKAEKVIARFEKKAQKDERIISMDGKFYLDTARYDYSDLIKK
jgi:hypothetical protein